MPWKVFACVTEGGVDPSLNNSRKDKGLGCGCAKERCSQESWDHVYLFDNDYENAMDKSKPKGSMMKIKKTKVKNQKSRNSSSKSPESTGVCRCLLVNGEQISEAVIS